MPEERIRRSFLLDHTVHFLAIFLLAGLALLLWHFSRVQSSVIETMALENAALVVALADSALHREVVERVSPLGINHARLQAGPRDPSRHADMLMGSIS
jgi:hypothetical protein